MGVSPEPKTPASNQPRFLRVWVLKFRKKWVWDGYGINGCGYGYGAGTIKPVPVSATYPYPTCLKKNWTKKMGMMMRNAILTL